MREGGIYGVRERVRKGVREGGKEGGREGRREKGMEGEREIEIRNCTLTVQLAMQSMDSNTIDILMTTAGHTSFSL